MKIYLIRHGQTDWNLTWKLQGQTDVPLNDTGVSQAKAAAQRLKEVPFDAVFASPLERARKTAEMIAESHKVIVETDERLKEIAFGPHEGTTPENDPDKEDRRVLFKTPEKYVPKEGAESYEDLAARCQNFLLDLTKLEKECVLVVAHGGLCKGLIREMLGARLSDFWKMPLMENCEELVVTYDQGKFTLPAVFEAFRGTTE